MEHMRAAIAAIAVVFALSFIFSIGMMTLIYGTRISAWEAANEYPFDRLCDMYRSCEEARK